MPTAASASMSRPVSLVKIAMPSRTISLGSLVFLCGRCARWPDVPLRSDVDGIRPGCVSLRRRQAKRAGYGIFLGLFDLAYLFLMLSLASFFVRFGRVGGGRLGLGVPVEVSASLPSSHRCFQAMAKVVFAVRRVGNFIPAEVDAASGARFADTGQQVHGAECERSPRDEHELGTRGFRAMLDGRRMGANRHTNRGGPVRITKQTRSTSYIVPMSKVSTCSFSQASFNLVTYK